VVRIDNDTTGETFRTNSIPTAQTYRNEHENDVVSFWLEGENGNDALIGESAERWLLRNPEERG